MIIQTFGALPSSVTEQCSSTPECKKATGEWCRNPCDAIGVLLPGDHGEVVKIGGAHYQGLPQSEALVSLDCVPDVLEECLTQKMPQVYIKNNAK